ncbi:MAG: isoleucine--tRNA ligase [Patescibacteria group bacterium]
MNFVENEHKILKFWKDNNIFQKLQDKNKGKKPWSFLDGPITANNPMGVHHAWGRTYKDLFQRYKAMRGHDERYQNGFDCQGLWVEVEVEKEKGFKSKKDIESYGVEKFIQDCKDRVMKYSAIQTEQSIRLGQWMNWDDSYFTMSDENNYTIWAFLKKCDDKGLLYKGKDVVPWCPRCGTAISQHEILTEEYKEITHKAVFIKFPVLSCKNTYFLAWTTTPWTLPGNVALAVHPKLEYVEVEKDGETFILLKSKADVVKGEIKKTFKGKKLKDIKYQGIFDELDAVKQSLESYEHRVIFWNEVSEEEGTGMVHIAPGCGQEDYQLSKELKIPVINPTDNESRYLDGFGDFSQKRVFVEETRDLIFDNLKRKGFVFKIENYAHRYPTCWRCKSELIFRLVDEWYIAMDPLREPLKKTVEKINWIPSFGKEREIDWLNNMHDWMISKKRYWGLALPIFECECGHFDVIGSKKELKERAVSGWEQFEGKSPHKPQVDNVKIKCSKCGKEVARIPDVGNPWLDAGIVSLSTLKYSNDKDYWRKWFPVDLISESFPGQFKNWFYALLVMSQVMTDSNPTKTIFGFATVKDEKGAEMHKSTGNAIWFDDGVEKMGADPMRWLYAKQNIVNDLKFGYNTVDEAKRRLLTLWNSFYFFTTYIENKDFLDDKLPKTENVLDKWILSKFSNLVEEFTKAMEEYNVFKANNTAEDFFVNDLSLWYIRRSRKRFQQEDGQEAIKTFYYVLLNLVKILAPTIPFATEVMYQELKTDSMPESVHLCDWPESNKQFIDLRLEEKMSKARDIVSLALAKRKEAELKVRQPLQSLKIKDAGLEELHGLILDEVNVKEIIVDEKIEDIDLDMNINDSLKREGVLREIIRTIQSLRKNLGLKPIDRVVIGYESSGVIKEVLDREVSSILSETKSDNVKEGKIEVDAEKELMIGGEKLWIGIKKV